MMGIGCFLDFHDSVLEVFVVYMEYSQSYYHTFGLERTIIIITYNVLQRLESKH